MPAGKLLARPTFTFSLVRGNYDADGAYTPTSGAEIISTYSVSLYLEYGVTPRFALAAALTAQTNWRHTAAEDIRTNGFGDSVVMGHIRLWNQSRYVPGFRISPILKIPTGRAVGDPSRLGTDVTGSGSIDASLGIGFTKALRPFMLYGTATYTHSFPTPVNGIDTAYGDAFSWSGAVEWPFWQNVLGLQLEVAGRNQASPQISGIRRAGADIRQLLLSVGLEVLASDRVKVILDYQRTLSGRNASAVDSVLVAIVPTFL